MATTRRDLLKLSGITAASLLLTPRVLAGWQPAQRYPDPAVVALDDSFRQYCLSTAKVERIAGGCRWAEGPVWFGDSRMLLWSDIPNNAIMRWDEITGQVSVFRSPCNFANGHARDRQGRLISCEHDTRRVTRTEYDGSITVLADSYQGKPLNSPNDVIVHSDGTIWFTDPPFGIAGFYEGHQAHPELPQNLYRFNPETKALTVAAADISGPNGLCFSPDEKTLYLVEGRAKPNRLILAFDVVNGELQNKRTHIDCGDGTADGIACDIHGNLWCGWGMGSETLDGVKVFNPAGKAIGMIHLPERCANLCFGGQSRNRLFMASSTSVYALYVNTQGAVVI
ncbi:SMP-30/gluconolactonase/LRE family protein [Enterobacillus tribolii]|uniref:Gluconolactonase n=1 Tax=Enterobacillus tribolii TaxID=1487935 RepID=A0A370R4P7_9GAMM|nr:SMP-30/gluconolactonase/LRE family protein [Enterobacillus tribolii]MBW7984346.1 SMP-30/gluconolactonase/LRE family protein [Enterobacillus tribolii]RDK97085.1 gluconolactonase [Enterobacillus tribolii]